MSLSHEHVGLKILAKNPNLNPHQSKDTLSGLLRDTYSVFVKTTIGLSKCV